MFLHIVIVVVTIVLSLDDISSNQLIIVCSAWSYCRSHYIRKKAEISTIDASKTRQLTPRQCRLTNSTTAERKICGFDFGGELPL